MLITNATQRLTMKSTTSFGRFQLAPTSICCRAGRVPSMRTIGRSGSAATSADCRTALNGSASTIVRAATAAPSNCCCEVKLPSMSSTTGPIEKESPSTCFRTDPHESETTIGPSGWAATSSHSHEDSCGVFARSARKTSTIQSHSQVHQ